MCFRVKKCCFCCCDVKTACETAAALLMIICAAGFVLALLQIVSGMIGFTVGFVVHAAFLFGLHKKSKCIIMAYLVIQVLATLSLYTGSVFLFGKHSYRHYYYYNFRMLIIGCCLLLAGCE